MPTNPGYYSMVIRGAKNELDIAACLHEAIADNIGEAAIKNLRRVARERIKSLNIKNLLDNKWHKQHRVNGSSHCQAAIASTEEYDELTMYPDPLGEFTGNVHKDPNAIALYSGEDNLRVGYISAKAKEFGDREGGLARWLTARINSGERWAVHVVARVGQGKASLGLRVELIQLEGTKPTDWPTDVNVEVEPIVPPVLVDLDEMDDKLMRIYLHRELLGDIARFRFKQIRSCRVKYGKYSQGCLAWLDEQLTNLDLILSL